MSLVTHLESTPANRQFLVGSDSTWSVGTVLQRVAAFRHDHPEMHRARVGLLLGDNVDTALALCALDGWTAEVALLPAGLTPSQLQAAFAGCHCNKLLTDQAFPNAIRWDRRRFVATEGDGLLSANEAETEWLLATSGTTGPPKFVVHSLASLTRSTKKDKLRGADFRWGLLYDVSRFAGLQVFLQCVCSGAALIVPPQRATLDQTAEQFIAANCNCLSATPTMWRKLLMTVAAHKLQLKNITLGGEIVDDAILRALKEAFPTATIRHIYASSEAGVGFAVSDGQAGFPEAMTSDQSLPVRVKVTPEGRLQLRIPERTMRYADRPDSLYDAGGWIDTGDLVTKRGDRYYFLGRASGAINVGGNKVHPEEVEGVLDSIPGVELALVRPLSNSIVGNLVQAEIVAEPGVDRAELRREILRRCRTELPPFKVPAIITFKDNIETGSTGKLKRGDSDDFK